MNGVKIFNNTFLGRVSMPEDDRDVTFINNIVHGGGQGHVRTHNLYTALMWNQATRYGWSPGEGEIVGYDTEADAYVPIDPASVYEDAGADHHLAATGPATNSGTDISSRLPTAIFPEVDFTLDLAGNPRGEGGGWDMGAYEYGESGSGPNDSGSNGTGSGGSSGGCFLSTP
jgi:hypothetical protein